MYTIHGTKKLLDRVKQPVQEPVESITHLGAWYANVIFWRPQVAIMVNERTLLPVLMPLAPAAKLADRFPDALEAVMDDLEFDPDFVEAEVALTRNPVFAKTTNRSTVGSVTEFIFMANAFSDGGQTSDLTALSVQLADVPCSPLYKTYINPKTAAAAVAEAWEKRGS